MRRGDLGAFWAKAFSGDIASSAGSATATPMPRRTARREICLLILHLFASPGPVPTVLERIAPRDLHHQRRDAVVVIGQRLADSLHRRGVVILYAPPQREGHHFFCKAPDEVVLPRQHQRPQLHGALEGASVGQRRRGFNRVGAVLVAPCPDRVVVLEREPDRIHPLVAVGAAGIGPVLLEPLPERELAVL